MVKVLAVSPSLRKFQKPQTTKGREMRIGRPFTLLLSNVFSVFVFNDAEKNPCITNKLLVNNEHGKKVVHLLVQALLLLFIA